MNVFSRNCIDRNGATPQLLADTDYQTIDVTLAERLSQFVSHSLGTLSSDLLIGYHAEYAVTSEQHMQTPDTCDGLSNALASAHPPILPEHEAWVDGVWA